MIKSALITTIVCTLLKREVNYTASNVDAKVEIPTDTATITIYFKADNMTLWVEKEEKE